MILEIIFAIYFVILILATFLLGINMVRTRDRLGIHPKIISFMLPFFINVPILSFSISLHSLSSRALVLFLVLSYPPFLFTSYLKKCKLFEFSVSLAVLPLENQLWSGLSKQILIISQLLTVMKSQENSVRKANLDIN